MLSFHGDTLPANRRVVVVVVCELDATIHSRRLGAMDLLIDMRWETVRDTPVIKGLPLLCIGNCKLATIGSQPAWPSLIRSINQYPWMTRGGMSRIRAENKNEPWDVINK